MIHALDLLRQVRDNRRPQIGQNVVVIGGGDVALDAAQTALRLGAERVLTVSLESRDILPASAEALELAEQEGVELDGSWGPTRILTQNGRVAEVELQRCLAVFDSLGRFAPRFDECSLKSVPADTVIIAIGQDRDPEFADRAGSCDPMTLKDGRSSGLLGRRRLRRAVHDCRSHGIGPSGCGKCPPAFKRTAHDLRPGLPARSKPNLKSIHPGARMTGG